MRGRILSPIAGLAFVVVACAPAEAPPAAPAVDLAAEEQAVRDVSMRWLELARAKDQAGIAALFADDGVLLREGASPAIGAAAIEAKLTQDQSMNPNSVPNWTTDRVEVAASGDLAVEFGTWSETGLGADGTGTDEGKYVTTYRKVGGTWRIASDASVSTRADAAATTTM